MDNEPCGVCIGRPDRSPLHSFAYIYGITDGICPPHIVDAISSAMPNSVQSIINVGATGLVARSNKRLIQQPFQQMPRCMRKI